MAARRSTSTALVAGIGVLGFVQGAYSTEVLRGAILAIPQGQIEAARAYGMSPGLLLRRITLPAMLPFAIPGLANLWLIATKDTALLAIVGVNELTQMTRNAGGATKAYFTFFIAAGALYLALTLVSEFIIARIERWARRGMPSWSERTDGGSWCSPTRQRRQRVLGWLQPHRIVLIAIALLIVASSRLSTCAGTGCRTISISPLQGIWRTIWLLVVTVGARACAGDPAGILCR